MYSQSAIFFMVCSVRSTGLQYLPAQNIATRFLSISGSVNEEFIRIMYYIFIVKKIVRTCIKIGSAIHEIAKIDYIL